MAKDEKKNQKKNDETKVSRDARTGRFIKVVVGEAIITTSKESTPGKIKYQKPPKKK